MELSQQTIRDCAPSKIYKEVGTAAKGKGGRPTKATKQAKSLTPMQVSAEEREAIEKMWAQKMEVATRPRDEAGQVAGTT